MADAQAAMKTTTYPVAPANKLTKIVRHSTTKLHYARNATVALRWSTIAAKLRPDL
jgi:hypothetical protein